MSNTTRWSIVAGVLVGMVCLATAADARPLQEILASRKIRLGTIPYPPMTRLDPATGEISGIWADGPRFLFRELGLEVEFVEVKWATFASALQSNQIDVFVGGSFATPKRSVAVDFSRPVMYMGHSIAVRKENAAKFKTIADLDKEGITIATVLGSSGHEYAREIFKHAEIKALDTGDMTAGILDVFAGRSDAAIQDSFKIAQGVAMHPDEMVDMFGDHPFHLVFVSYAVSKGRRDLLQLINTGLDWMDSTGKWEELALPYGGQLKGVYFVKPVYRPFGGPAARE